MARTVHVSDKFTLRAGETLQFHDQTGFELDSPGSGGDAPYLIINGAATVVSKVGSFATGIVDMSDAGLINVGRHGSLTVTSGGSAIGADLENTEIDNAGAITVAAGGGGMAAGVRFGDVVGELSNTGTISAAGGFWTYGVLGGFEIHNSGVIQAIGMAGNTFGAAVDSFYLDNSGRVEMDGGVAIAARVSYLANSGLIQATGDFGATAAIIGAGAWLHNDGRIIADGGEGESTAVVVFALGETAPTTLTNTGLIEGDIWGGRIPDSPIELDNSGRILGQVSLGWGADQVDNAGLIRGEVNLYDGDDTFRMSGAGRVVGAVHGDGGDDLLIGGAGADVLMGDGREDQAETPGADTLQGNGGADTLTGGAAADVFVYASITDSTSPHADLITDLSGEDRIDLSQIDANTTKAGDQAFHLVGRLTGHAGELTLGFSPLHNLTTLSADVNGDGIADLVITIAGDHRDFTDFIL